ncbi:MAG TPA: bifunctional phosphoribosylaminoimidazolecarboxamide formyltransferase/IMP cyclohydrolase [Thermoanaerobaculia bacterium]|nr:bifunctional phosphoribosylaminoimidazolecarboxamide formyltransferase/IMP cyclohydrolase [Thermoanaerobaculia bacterium]
MPPARRALISVFDKRGLADFARGLAAAGFEIVSTGGTLRFLAEKEIPATSVSAVTGFPEILDGRVKTLHPLIHGGILADRSRPAHGDEIAAHGIVPIDLVAVNLYPFRETVGAGATAAQAVEMIDVGGPTMVRAAAKNFHAVTVVVDPLDYPEVLAAIAPLAPLAPLADAAGGGAVPEALRRRLAAKAFRHVERYDGAIADWLERQGGEREGFPAELTLHLTRELSPRYGENPHQKAAVYRLGDDGVLGGLRQLGGKELSWNNLLDADAARKIAGSFAEPAVVIVKHNNPCGVGRGGDLAAAYRRALATDPTSAFGGIVAANRPLDEAAAAAIAELFVEVLIAPGFEPAALARLGEKKSLRLLECPLYRPAAELELRSLAGGFLAQGADALPDDPAGWTCPTRRRPDDEERRALDFAWRVARYVKSNAIVLATPDQTVGIGAGQMSRVDSCRLAIQKALLPTAGAAAASDAFFPFRDGLDALAAAGVRAVVQPGGSRRDDEVVAAADGHGIAMLFTGVRHFRH